MMNKAALYFHIPFCLRRCDYCDFCSFTGKNEADFSLYTEALLREMAEYRDKTDGLLFDTLFFGGGTPSLLPTACVERLISFAKEIFSVAKDAEITLEANPATVNREGLARLRELGINRLSIGVQSLVDGELCRLGRLHTASDAQRIFHDARAVGFDNINVDLMYGIPEQTVESAKETLDGVLRLSPDHISAYSLMLEEGTPLYLKRGALSFPTEEEEEAIDALLKQTLASHGYQHYEISNFAKVGRECRHNLHYWRSEPYLGFGVAAYSFFNTERYGNACDLAKYLQDPTAQKAESEVLTDDALAYEWIMLRLRLKEGISVKEYFDRFGVDLRGKYGKTIEKYTVQGLMHEKEGRIALTERGFRVSNAILVSFMPDSSENG